MAITNEQKISYRNNICSLCVHKDNCDKDKFIATDIYDRVSIKCLEYEYINKDKYMEII